MLRSKKLTSQQQKALELLGTGKTIAVASSLDLNRTTIWRWTKTPEISGLIEYIDC